MLFETMARLSTKFRLFFYKDKKCVALLLASAAFCFCFLVFWMPRGKLADYATPSGRKLIFMKNHKCASSTVENIILRYSFENKLNVVIPAQGAYLSRENLFERSSLASAPWANLSFDVFSLHNRWQHSEVVELIGDGVPTLTIVRDPVGVFVSLWHYWAPVRDQYNVSTLHQLVELITRGNSSELLSQRWIGQFGRNQMAWDLGIASEFFDNDQMMDDYVEKLDKQFDLVMIASKMDESLVLLRHLLQWPIERMQHLDRNRKKKAVNPSDLSTEEKETLYRWLSADTKIYRHFVRRFDEKVDELNRRFDDLAPFGQSYVDYEASQLRKLNRNLYQRCVLKEGASEEVKLSADYAEYNGAVGFLVNEEHEDCKLFAWTQGAYLKRLKEILVARVNETLINASNE